MKKNIALLLGLVLGLGFVSCSSDDDDDDEYTNGEGKYLAEMQTTRYDWKDGKRSNEGKPFQLIRYDKEGRYIGEDNFTSGHRTDIIFDTNGDRLEERVYDLNDLKTLTTTCKYEYNYVDSILVISVYNWKGNHVYTYRREYDYTERLIKLTEIVDSIGKDYGNVYTYSYSGNVETIDVTKVKDGSFSERIVHEEDSHGYIIKTTVTYNNGSTTSTEYINEYDSNGRLLKRTGPIYNNSVNYGYTEYTYNDDGTIKKQHVVARLNSPKDVGPVQNEEYDLEYTYKYKKK